MMKNKTSSQNALAKFYSSWLGVRFQYTYQNKNHESGRVKQVSKRQERAFIITGVVLAVVLFFTTLENFDNKIEAALFASCIGVSITVMLLMSTCIFYDAAARWREKKEKKRNFLLAVEEVLYPETAEEVLRAAEIDAPIGEWLHDLLQTEGMEIITSLTKNSAMIFEDALELTLALKQS